MQNETLCEYRLTLSRKKLVDNKINVREIKDPTEPYHNVASSGNGRVSHVLRLAQYVAGKNSVADA